jgi:hypothetical protein
VKLSDKINALLKWPKIAEIKASQGRLALKSPISFRGLRKQNENRLLTVSVRPLRGVFTGRVAAETLH